MYALPMSSIVDSSGILIVFEIAPERNGCAAAIILTWPVHAIERPPPRGASEQSKTGRCSAFRYGAPSILPCLSMYETISLVCSGVYSSRINACGTVLLTILMTPPPTNFLYLTNARSGSIPVVSQSIMKPIVPVGASTVTCELRNPFFVPSSYDCRQHSSAALNIAAGTCLLSMLLTAFQCI